MPLTRHTRVAFEFDGELEDLTLDMASALAGTARALLRHSDVHDGRPATMRMARLGPLLNLWLNDPECSPACLRGSGHLPIDLRDTPPRDVRLVLESGPDSGLRLHWAMVLPAEPMAVSSRRWRTHRRDLTRTH
jgi:hypothetical protein